jgi:hypothetical protein
MAGESHLQAKVESAADALFATEARNCRVYRHPFTLARARFDHTTELMTRNDAVFGDEYIANPTLLKPMSVGSTQSKAEHPYQNLTRPGHPQRDLDLFHPTNVDESNRCFVLDGHLGVIASSLGGSPVAAARRLLGRLVI